MTPRRLVDTTRNDFERKLLRSAATERAPEAARKRALASVALALSNDSHSAPPGGDENCAVDRASARRPSVRRSLSGVSLGMLALAASVALLLWQRTPNGAQLTEDPLPASGTRTRAPAPPVEGAAATRSTTDTQRALANTQMVAPRLQPGSSLLQTLAEDDAPDWLGAQLQLLREARRQLELGSLEQTQGLLDSYEQRFPGGVVGPQISALRAELQRRQNASAQ